MQTALNETRDMLKTHINRAPCAIKKVQETFLYKKGEEMVKILSKRDTKRMLKKESRTFNRIELLFNLDYRSIECRGFHD